MSKGPRARSSRGRGRLHAEREGGGRGGSAEAEQETEAFRGRWGLAAEMGAGGWPESLGELTGAGDGGRGRGPRPTGSRLSLCDAAEAGAEEVGRGGLGRLVPRSRGARPPGAEAEGGSAAERRWSSLGSGAKEAVILLPARTEEELEPRDKTGSFLPAGIEEELSARRATRESSGAPHRGSGEDGGWSDNWEPREKTGRRSRGDRESPGGFTELGWREPGARWLLGGRDRTGPSGRGRGRMRPSGRGRGRTRPSMRGRGRGGKAEVPSPGAITVAHGGPLALSDAPHTS